MSRPEQMERALEALSVESLDAMFYAVWHSAKTNGTRRDFELVRDGCVAEIRAALRGEQRETLGDAQPEPTVYAEVRRIQEEYVGFRRNLRSALYPVWPNNPGVGNDEIVAEVGKLVALATSGARDAQPEPVAWLCEWRCERDERDGEKAMSVQIKSRWSGAVLYESEKPTLWEAVVEAVVRGAHLRGANLRNVNLSGAVLRNADLSNADLRNVNLSNADLSNADLRAADLRNADLRNVNLSYADLSYAVLSGAVVRNADLSNADLRAPKTPKIPDIHRAVYAAASQPGALDMGSWHTCDTTHCRAGWVTTLAGEEGRALEDRVGPATAAALIYLASDPTLERVPDFYASNEDALADMARLAGVTAVPSMTGAPNSPPNDWISREEAERHAAALRETLGDAQPEPRNPDAELEREYALLREYERRKLGYSNAIHGRLAWEADKATTEVTEAEVDAAEHWLDAFMTPLIRRAALATSGAPEQRETDLPERCPWCQGEIRRAAAGFTVEFPGAEKAKAARQKRETDAERGIDEWRKDAGPLGAAACLLTNAADEEVGGRDVTLLGPEVVALVRAIRSVRGHPETAKEPEGEREQLAAAEPYRDSIRKACAIFLKHNLFCECAGCTDIVLRLAPRRSTATEDTER